MEQLKTRLQSYQVNKHAVGGAAFSDDDSDTVTVTFSSTWLQFRWKYPTKVYSHNFKACRLKKKLSFSQSVCKMVLVISLYKHIIGQ